MQKNILLLQFRKNSKTALHEKECILSSINKKGVKLIPKNIFKNNSAISDGALSTLNGVIIGGSGDFSISKRLENKKLWRKIENITPFIKEIIKTKIPILGICLGHQYLAHILGAKIIKDRKQEETGSFEISLTKAGRSSFLFKGINSRLLVHEGHKDSVSILPKGAILLAKGKKCRIQSFSFDNIYTVQFHPELNTKKNATLRAKFSPNYINKKFNFQSCPESAKVLNNFIENIKQKSIR